MMNRALIAALVLALFASHGCVSAGFGWGQSSSWAAGWGWQSLVLIAVALVAFALALGYMAASLLSDEKMKAWVTKEVGQLFYSMLIILFVLGSIGPAEELAKGVIIGSGTPGWQTYIENTVCCDPAQSLCLKLTSRACHVEVAYDYLQYMYENMRENAGAYFVNHYFNSFLSFVNIGFGARMLVHLGSFSIRPLAGLSMGTDFFSILFDLAIKNMMLLRLQQMFIDNFVAGFFPVMLSTGLVLRIFYFTRKLGGTLVALSLAVYFVFPMFYVAGNSIFFRFVTTDIYQSTPSAMGVYYSGENLPFMQSGIDLGDADANVFQMDRINVIDFCRTATAQEKDEGVGPMVNFRERWKDVSGGKWLLSLKNFFNAATGQAFALDGPIATLSAMMVFTLIFPFLGVMTTLGAYKVISPLIGGDIELALLSRLL